MDQFKFVEILKATLDPAQNKQADEHLEQIHKIIGFAPELLKVVMTNEVALPIRQAGAVYLKNEISKHWPPPSEDDVKAGEPLEFSIHEQDKGLIRSQIIEAMVHSPEIIRNQLALCVHTIVRYDFPGRWPDMVDKIGVYLENPEVALWPGTLLALYQLCKGFEFKKGEERQPFLSGMSRLLPLLFQRCVELQQQHTNGDMCLIQKQIMKIFHSLIAFSLPMEVVTKPVLSQWLELAIRIVESDLPPEALKSDHVNGGGDESYVEDDDDDRDQLPWWKIRKWCMHIIVRVFERYGLPGQVSKEYKEIADWHVKTFPPMVYRVVFKFLEAHRMKTFVAPRIMQQIMNYLAISMSSASCYKLLKPHLPSLLEHTIFPMLCFSDSDENLWKSDPKEYIKQKFDAFEDLVSPVEAAAVLLERGGKKRKDFLDKSMLLASNMLQDPNVDARKKDGALHMVGVVSEVLMKRAPYKDQLEGLLVANLVPAFASPCGFLRARACWLVQKFASMPFKDTAHFQNIVHLVLRSLLSDPELPVKVESAMAVQELLTEHDDGMKLLEPEIKRIVMEILHVIRETQNDDLTTVLQRIVHAYHAQLAPIIVEVVSNLAQTFSQICTSSEDEGVIGMDKNDDQVIAAMGLMNTMDNIAEVFDEEPEIMAAIEPILLQVAHHILSTSIVDLYEEAFTLVGTLTAERVSPDCWKMFELLYQVFERDALDYFTDMMAALYHFVTVDVNAFLANNDRVLAIFNICKQILTSDPGEDTECHAAKLLEIILINCKGRIDACVQPFVELALSRIMCKEVITSELRTMCLQVVIAAVLYNPGWVISEIIPKIQFPPMNPTEGPKDTLAEFISMWLKDVDCFLGLHDRKVCILGLCALMSLDPAVRPKCINDQCQSILPSIIVLFDGIKRAYEVRAREDNESDDEVEEESDSDGAVDLDSDEDDVRDIDSGPMQRIARRIQRAGAENGMQVTTDVIDADEDEEDDDEDYEPEEETDLEVYTTALDDESSDMDEFVVFKQIMHALPSIDPQWYAALTTNLEKNQMSSVQELAVLADQRKAQAESKKIEQSGGYKFTQQTVPSTFNFGGN